MSFKKQNILLQTIKKFSIYLIFIPLINFLALYLWGTNANHILHNHLAIYISQGKWLLLAKYLNYFSLNWLLGIFLWCCKEWFKSFFLSYLQYDLDKLILKKIEKLSPAFISFHGSHDFRTHAELLQSSITNIIDSFFGNVVPAWSFYYY